MLGEGDCSGRRFRQLAGPTPICTPHKQNHSGYDNAVTEGFSKKLCRQLSNVEVAVSGIHGGSCVYAGPAYVVLEVGHGVVEHNQPPPPHWPPSKQW